MKRPRKAQANQPYLINNTPSFVALPANSPQYFDAGSLPLISHSFEIITYGALKVCHAITEENAALMAIGQFR